MPTNAQIEFASKLLRRQRLLQLASIHPDISTHGPTNHPVLSLPTSIKYPQQVRNATCSNYCQLNQTQEKTFCQHEIQNSLGLPNKVTKYEYDKVGNREQVTENAVTTTYQPNPLNQYDSINNQSLSYDLNGNLINNNGWNYQYDAQNRLITASNGITQATFAYDGRNRCVSRTINGNTTYLYYDDWNLIEERDINDNLLASYVHGEKIDEIICRIIPGNTIYYHHDALGNVTLLTDNSGKLIEHYTYDPFGKPTILNATNGILQTSAYGNRFLFTGREYLSRLDLYDYRNRVYSVELGRFIQVDPIGFKAGDVNLYRYVNNNPINLTDSFGLESDDCDCLNRCLDLCLQSTSFAGNCTLHCYEHCEEGAPSPFDPLAGPTPPLPPAPKNTWEALGNLLGNLFGSLF